MSSDQLTKVTKRGLKEAKRFDGQQEGCATQLSYAWPISTNKSLI